MEKILLNLNSNISENKTNYSFYPNYIIDYAFNWNETKKMIKRIEGEEKQNIEEPKNNNIILIKKEKIKKKKRYNNKSWRKRWRYQKERFKWFNKI